jgi:DNA-binding YbaB/EbfC family protein
MASINKLMKQAMRAQQQAQEVEAALAERTVEASSGGGAVKVVATCKGVIKSLKIDPEAVDPEEVESLEDMVLLAVNNAVEEGQKIQAEEMGKVTSGFGLPGMG